MTVVLWPVIVGVIVISIGFISIGFGALADSRRRRRVAQGPAKLGEHLKRGRAKQDRDGAGLLERHRGCPDCAQAAIRGRRIAG